MRTRAQVLAASVGGMLSLLGTQLAAAPVYQPPGANLTLGDVTHGFRALSAAGNPAAAAADAARSRQQETDHRGGIVVSGVAGIEFGNLDELYDLIDNISNSSKPSEPPPPPTPENPIHRPGSGIGIGDIIDICCPDLREKIDRIEEVVTNRVALLAAVKVDAYAKTFESVDIPVMIGGEAAGGAWSFSYNWSRLSKSYSFVDSTIDFDGAQALADLENQYDLMPGDTLEAYYDIAGDVDVLVNPVNGLVRILIDNDSALVTKATQTNELSMGYGRELGNLRNGDVFIGGELSYYNQQLARTIFRYGDITDTEEIFDSIRDAEYVSDGGFGVDIGMLWARERMQIGAFLTNINEPSFIYPDTDLTDFTDAGVIQQLNSDRVYTMERQLKLEASLFTENRRWSVNFGLDANDTVDPMGDEFQWLTVSGGWTTNNNWLRNARFGYRENLVGTELRYLSAGVTAFKWFNIDLATEIDEVVIDDDELPRGLILSLGFQLDF